MNNLSQPIWTYQLVNESLIIDNSLGLVTISITLNSGTGTIKGGGLAGSLPSKVIDLVVGQAVTISSEGEIPLGEFTISTTGVLAIIGKQ